MESVGLKPKILVAKIGVWFIGKAKKICVSPLS
jgi:hypothetical protein